LEYRQNAGAKTSIHRRAEKVKKKMNIIE